MADYTFPDDLVALRREFYALERLLDTLPPDGEGERDDLRTRQRALAVALSKHPYWAECGNRTDAGYKLQQMIAVEAADGDADQF
jgi:hypothetical protein